MHNFHKLLAQALAENELAINHTQQQKLINYLELLQTWNRVFNLTTITKPRDMVYLHIIDSLLIQPYLQGTQYLDVGSGAGLPGIPLAIIHPEHHWVLLDKNNKKTRFITQVVAELKLPSIDVIHKRCEAFHPQYGFDNIVSRAFGNLRLFIESTAHLLGEGGIFIAMKGKLPQKELDDIPNGFMVENVIRLYVKGTSVERHLVRIRPN
ncbi:MAG TPA: 16S rRNA (guanine(527)-N(7))-methyltransferase RsmG [Gammaproteobacteria bacterium]|nr:16S rRNA (guanine(527)-N(7))-methyltransferase RsmG [Gammaproteobacteria bacterium]